MLNVVVLVAPMIWLHFGQTDTDTQAAILIPVFGVNTKDVINLPEHVVPTSLYPDEHVVHSVATVQASQFEAQAESKRTWHYN